MPVDLTTYRARTTPYAHQVSALRVSYAKRAFALFMDPGTGKTKVIIDTAALHFFAGHITGLLIIAPNDVHAQWIDEQLPLHMPDEVSVRAVVWDGGKASVLRQVTNLLRPLPGRLHVLAMNMEALATRKGVAVARRFLTAYRSLFVLDESHNFANPSAARTKAALGLSELAFARRILSGTPMDGDPFQLWAQFAFLHPRIIGIDSFLVFKHRYGIFTKEPVTVKGQYDEHGNPKRRSYEALQEYRRLNELYGRIAPYTFQCRKADCRDMPPVLRAQVYTHLSERQARLYASLRDHGIALLQRAERGEAVDTADLALLGEEDLHERLNTADNRMTVAIKLVLLLRLRQCAAGFATDDGKRTALIDGTWTDCPRIVTTVERVEQALAANPDEKVVVWAHYRAALEILMRALTERLGKGRTTLIHGGITGAARTEAIDAFKRAPNPSVLVAHPRTMGVGQNLGMATTAIFYTNDYSWTQRRQTEDRIDRIDRAVPCTLVDIVARDAHIDRLLLATHQEKAGFNDAFAKLTATQLMGLL